MFDKKLEVNMEIYNKIINNSKKELKDINDAYDKKTKILIHLIK